jgi:hypothetical protein
MPKIDAKPGFLRGGGTVHTHKKGPKVPIKQFGGERACFNRAKTMFKLEMK